MNMHSYNCCANQTIENTQILSQLSLIKLLSDKNRLQILCVLSSEKHTVRDLVRHLTISQSLVSHHLIALKKLTIVEGQKNGRQVTYTLTKKGQHVINLLRLLSTKEEK